MLNFTQKGQSGWAKFPGKRIINSKIFEKLHLRHKNELNALKLYFLLTAHRNTALNSTNIGYEKIETYTGIKRTDICSAISLLINYGLVQVERGVGDINARSNTYRVCGIDHRHAGNMNYEDYNTKAAMKEFGVVEA